MKSFSMDISVKNFFLQKCPLRKQRDIVLLDYQLIILFKERIIMKKIFIGFLIATIVFIGVIPNNVAFAGKLDKSKCDRLISAIEGELREKGTTVEEQLARFAHDYETIELDEETSKYEKFNTITVSQKVKFNLVNDYTKYKSTNDAVYVDPRNPYKAAVSVVVAYFKANGYNLAAELLVQARDNKQINSQYRPKYGYLVEKSPIFQSCKHDYSSNFGYGAFEKEGNTFEDDLYYAIHAFEWYRLSNNRIQIRDIYDYSFMMPDSIEDLAVDTMWAAQEYGVITPYIVLIER